jgi:hypothetical protein
MVRWLTDIIASRSCATEASSRFTAARNNFQKLDDMSIYRIKGPWPGNLSIVSRPRGGDWLEQEISGWKDAELNTVVSLLTSDEEAEFELLGERESSEEQGLRFYSLPIADLGVPSSRKETLAVLSQIENLLAAGQMLASTVDRVWDDQE